MSVSSTTSRIQYTLSSATQTVAVSFFFIEESHLWVTRTRGGVITTLILATHYTTTGQGSESGGAIIFNGAGTQVGDVITILRNVPITQLVDYAYNGRFPAETTERALDRLTMVSQMLAEKISRSVRFAEGETLDGSMQPGGRLGKVLSFDPVTGALQYLDPVSAVWESGVGLQVTSMAALALVSSSQVVRTETVAAVISGMTRIQWPRLFLVWWWHWRMVLVGLSAFIPERSMCDGQGRKVTGQQMTLIQSRPLMILL